MILHVTNGDCAADLLKASGITGDVLAWRDVLHEGPVPSNCDSKALARIRAEFISGCGWGDSESVFNDFMQRDARLADALHVVLWFEHDLFDQLQLIQILSRLEAKPKVSVELICIDRHPGRVPFFGLGELYPEDIADLYPSRIPVPHIMRQTAARIWDAFCSSQPTILERWTALEPEGFPFLPSALIRFFQQFPYKSNGLCRTERTIIRILLEEKVGMAELFKRAQSHEEAPFLGDTTFYLYAERLSRCAHPLLECEDGVWRVTPVGEAILGCEEHHLRLNSIDRWRGGCHLHSDGGLWVWDEQANHVIPWS